MGRHLASENVVWSGPEEKDSFKTLKSWPLSAATKGTPVSVSREVARNACHIEKSVLN